MEKKPSKKVIGTRKRLIPYLVLLVLSVLAVVLFVQLDRINTPPQRAVNPDTPATGGAAAKWLYSLYGHGEEDTDSFFLPFKAAVAPNGDILVSDTGNSRIVRFDSDRRYIEDITGTADGAIVLSEPLGITISSGGDIYIADRGLSKIIVLNKDLELKFFVVESIPITPVLDEAAGRLYVSAYDRINVFDLEGELITRWGTRGREDGQFDFPNGLVVDRATDVVYVSDSNNKRLQAFNTEGEHLWSVGKPVTEINEIPIEFDLPAGLAQDERGFLYLVDTFDNSVKILDARGRERAIIGDYGFADGLFNYPVGITYTGDGIFLVADRGNDRIQSIEILPPEEAMPSREIAAVTAEVVAAPIILDQPEKSNGVLRAAGLLSAAALLVIIAAYILNRGRKRKA